MGYSDVFFGGIEEGYPLVVLLGADGGAKIGSSDGMSDDTRDGKLEGYPLGYYTFSSEERSEVIYYVGILYGKVGSSVGISDENI